MEVFAVSGIEGASSSLQLILCLKNIDPALALVVSNVNKAHNNVIYESLCCGYEFYPTGIV